MSEPEARVLLDVAAGVATITLHRPDVLNALDVPTLLELERAVSRAAADAAVRAVVLTGAGRAFCAGADVNEWAAGEPAAEDWTTVAHRLIAVIYELPKPVIAAVNGVAVGAGFDLALAADFRVAAESARFGSVYVRLGIPPDAGASFFLPLLVGVTRAKELIYSGRIFPAAEALELGVVSEVVPAGELAGRAADWAAELAAGPTVAIGLAKSNIHALRHLSIEAALRREALLARIAMQTEDQAEGLAAAVDKRSPAFKGR